MKLSPLSCLALLSLIVGCASEPQKPMTEAEYNRQMAQLEARLDHAIDKAINADTHQESEWDSRYYESLAELQSHCLEHRADVVEATMLQVQKIDRDGIQFAWLNMIEESIYQIQKQSTEKIQCVPVIEALYY